LCYANLPVSAHFPFDICSSCVILLKNIISLIEIKQKSTVLLLRYKLYHYKNDARSICKAVSGNKNKSSGLLISCA